MYDNQKNNHVIRRNHRLYVAEGTYFITSVTAQRKPLFQDQEAVELLKQNFTWNYKKMKGIPSSTSIVIWQSGSWDHVIRNEDDYGKHLDYIHYNPVKHEYVTKPEDFAYTSYIEYIKKGWYEIGWGYKEPDKLRDMNFE
jgi:REP element-mobilizing transposase RayT